jgi:hypothetical protein
MPNDTMTAMPASTPLSMNAADSELAYAAKNAGISLSENSFRTPVAPAEIICCMVIEGLMIRSCGTSLLSSVVCATARNIVLPSVWKNSVKAVAMGMSRNLSTACTAMMAA